MYEPKEIETRWREKVKAPPAGDKELSLPAVACIVPRLGSVSQAGGERLRVMVHADSLARFLRLRGQTCCLPLVFNNLDSRLQGGTTDSSLSQNELYKQAESELSGILGLLGVAVDGGSPVPVGDRELLSAHQDLFLQLRKEKVLRRRRRVKEETCSGCGGGLSHLYPGEKRCPYCGMPVEWVSKGPWLMRLARLSETTLESVKWARWPPWIKHQQRALIGRKPGLEVNFKVGNRFLGEYEDIQVFVERPEYLLAMGFLYVSASHPLLDLLLDGLHAGDVNAFRQKLRSLSSRSYGLVKEVAFTGLHVINPVTYERLPVVVSSHIPPAHDGLVGVPAYCEFDRSIAVLHHLSIRKPFTPAGDKGPGKEAKCVIPGEFEGETVRRVRERITEKIARSQAARSIVRHNLRSAVCTVATKPGIPVPLVPCPNCGEKPAPELPFTGGSSVDWEEGPWTGQEERAFRCPQCGGIVEERTYSLDWRTPLIDPILQLLTRKPAGDGSIHIIALIQHRDHAYPLLVANALSQFLSGRYLFFEKNPVGSVRFVGGAKSQSDSLTAFARNRGADATRIVLLTASSPGKDFTLTEGAFRGAERFLGRLVRTFRQKCIANANTSARVEKARDRMLYELTANIDKGRFHLGFVSLSSFVRYLARPWIDPNEVDRKTWLIVARCLFPFAPHHAAEIYEEAKEPGQESIFSAPWPEVPENPPPREQAEIAVFIDGKRCDSFTCSSGTEKNELGRMAMGCGKVRDRIRGRRVKLIFAVKDRVVNIVPERKEQSVSSAEGAPSGKSGEAAGKGEGNEVHRQRPDKPSEGKSHPDQ